MSAGEIEAAIAQITSSSVYDGGSIGGTAFNFENVTTVPSVLSSRTSSPLASR